MADRIHVEITGDAKDLGAAAGQAIASIQAVDKAAATADKSQQKYGATTRANARDVDALDVRLRGLDTTLNRVNQKFTFTRNAIGLIKFPALGAGAGLAADALFDVAAGLTAIIAASAPAAGAVVGVAQSYTALGQGLGTVLVASRGVGDALKAQTDALDGTEESAKKARQAMRELSAEQRDFVKWIGQNRGVAEGLTAASARGLFPGVQAGGDAALRNLDVLEGVLERTGDAMGYVAEQAGRMVGGREFGREMEVIGNRNAEVLEDLGDAALNLVDALGDVLVAADPFVSWLTQAAKAGSENVEAWAQAGEKSGETAAFFRETRWVLQDLHDIGGNLIGTLVNIGGAGYESGRDLMQSLEDVTGRWEEWTGSVEGQNEMADYFDHAKEATEEVAGLIGDLAEAWARLGGNENSPELIRQIREELVPALEEALDNLATTLGPALIDTLVSVVELFAELSEDGGGLALAVELIGDVVDGITWLIDIGGPGLKEALSVGLAGMTLYKILGIGAAISGVDTLIKRLKTAGTVAGGVGAAAGAGSVLGAAAGAAAGSWTRGKGGAMVWTPGAGGAAGGAVGGAVAKAGARGAIGAGLGVLGGPWGMAAGAAGVAAYSGVRALEEGRESKALEKYNEQLDRLVRRRDVTGLKALGDQVRDTGEGFKGAYVPIDKAFDDLSDDARQAATQDLPRVIERVEALQKLAMQDVAVEIDTKVTTEGALKVAGTIDRMRKGVSNSVEQLRTNVRLSMRAIKTEMDASSSEGKSALSKNFDAAIINVKRSMREGTLSTKEGMREIERLMRKNLAMYGITGEQASRYIDGRDTLTGKRNADSDNVASNNVQGKAGGGFIGKPGQAGQDTQLIRVGLGEAIVNGPQQDVINAALATTFGTDLDGLFQRVNKPHWVGGGHGKGMQGGGIVGLGKWIQSMGYAVGEHPAFGGVTGGHAPGGWHYKAGALDVNADTFPGGEPAALDRLNAMLRAKGWHTLWRVPDHFDHLHVDLGAGGGGAMAALEQIAAPKWTGPGGAVGAAGQAAVAAVAAGANASLAKAFTNMSAGGGGGQMGGAAMGDAALRSLIEQALRMTGHYTPGNAAALFRRVMQESGGDPNAVNNWDVNAANGDPSIGLAQVIGSTFQAYRDPSLPNSQRHPLANLVAAINYMIARYGHIVDANGQGYARGGRVGRAAAGLPARVRFNRRQNRNRSRAAEAAAKARAKRPRGSLVPAKNVVNLGGVPLKGAPGLTAGPAPLTDSSGESYAHRFWEGELARWAAEVRAGLRGQGEVLPLMETLSGQILAGARGQLVGMERLDILGDLQDARGQDPAIAMGEERDRILAEIGAQTIAGERLAGQQFGALSSFAGILGQRSLGTFAHGGRVVGNTQLAVVHPGETITPDPNGPYGTGQARPAPVSVAAPQVTVIVDRDGRASATVDGRPVDVVSQRTGQRTRALIAAANGRR
jgi:hypothetical protein